MDFWRHNPLSQKRRNFLRPKLIEYAKQRNVPLHLQNFESLPESQKRQIFQDIEKAADDLMGFIAEADPTTSGEYATWIAHQHITNHISLPEDIEKVQEDLTLYHEKKKRKVIPPESRDINKMTYHQLGALVNQYREKLSERELLEQGRKSTKEVYKSDSWRVLEVTNWMAAKELCQNTNWCVRGTDMAQHYTQDPKYPLYLFFRKNDMTGEFERFGLLTNRPDEQQFRDTSDSSIPTSLIQVDEELHGLAQQFSDWIVCHCGKVTMGKETEGYVTRQQIQWNIFDDPSQLTFPAGSYLIADVLPAIAYQPVVADPKLLERKTVIGPASQIMRQFPDPKLPNVEKFAEQAGYSAASYYHGFLAALNNARCLHIQPDDAAEVFLFALYVIVPCEDFPSCGHEVSPRGIPTCPPRLPDGEVVGYRCECGAFVPSTSDNSICKTCLSHRDDDEDAYAREQEVIEDVEDFEGCHREQLLEILEDTLNKWGRDAWNPIIKAGEPVIWEGRHPKWEDFHKLAEVTQRSFQYLQPTIQEIAHEFLMGLNSIAKHGWFAEEQWRLMQEWMQMLLPLLQAQFKQKKHPQGCCS